MNREQLKEIGIADEQLEGVMKLYGKSINELKDKANSIDGLESQIEDYKNQLKERDTQLEELSNKAKGNEDLTAQIDELKAQNEQTKTEYENKLNEQAFNHKLENTLSGAKVKNAKAVKALLDLDIVKLEDGELKGLNEQLESLKENESYLFESEQEGTKPNFTTGQHKTEKTNNDPFAKILAKYKN